MKFASFAQVRGGQEQKKRIDLLVVEHFLFLRNEEIDKTRKFHPQPPCDPQFMQR